VSTCRQPSALTGEFGFHLDIDGNVGGSRQASAGLPQPLSRAVVSKENLFMFKPKARLSKPICFS